MSTEGREEVEAAVGRVTGGGAAPQRLGSKPRLRPWKGLGLGVGLFGGGFSALVPARVEKISRSGVAL